MKIEVGVKHSPLQITSSEHFSFVLTLNLEIEKCYIILFYLVLRKFTSSKSIIF